MIGKLRGILDIIHDNYLIIDVNGVGYVVNCTSKTLNLMPDLGSEITLSIETIVREDNISLYGFSSEAEKRSFKELSKVNGVGLKTALAILSSLDSEALALAVVNQDLASFKPIPGIGPKLAGRILNDLKDKFKSTDLSRGPQNTTISNNHVESAISALSNLGYSRNDVQDLVNKIVANNNDIGLNDLIKDTLKEMAK